MADLRQPPEADLGLDIGFAAGSEAPSRVFRTMTDLIDGFEAIDLFLVTIGQGLKIDGSFGLGIAGVFAPVDLNAISRCR